MDARDALRGTVVAVLARLRKAAERARAVEFTLNAQWAPAVIALGTVGQAYAVYRTLWDLPDGVWPVLKDSVIFEYIGWYLSTGGRLYLDIWEVKPPLSFELLAVLSVLSDGDMVVYHSLVLLFSSLLIVGCALAVAGIVREVTGDGLAAVAGGLFVFALPQFYWRAIIGFKAKYLVIAAGLGALYYALRRRPYLAGGLAAAAVWTWQLAVIFPAVTFATLAAETRDRTASPDPGWLGRDRWGFDRTALGRYVAAAGGVTALVLVPIVAWGALEAMLTEIVLTPFLTTEEFTFWNRAQFIVRMHGRTLPFAIVGVLGLGAGVLPGRRRALPAAALAGWFAFVMMTLDFDSRPDLFPWFALVAVGVGLAVGWGRSRYDPDTVDVDARRVLAAGLLVFAAVSVGTMGGFGTGRQGLASPETFDTDSEVTVEMTSRGLNVSERQYIFWNAVPPQNCRVLGGLTQFRLVNRMGLAEGQPWFEAPCGDIEPAWAVFREKYL